MPDLPLVSIVTPSYNQAQFIGQTIESVLSQDYPRLEYLVIDGGSDDGTLDILHSYGDRLWWVSEPDQGQADAINKGLRQAAGQIVAYLNSDDLYLPGAISTVVAAWQQQPQAGLIFGDCRVIDAAGRQRALLPGRPFDVQHSIRLGSFIPQPAAFWRAEVMDRVGWFDTDLHYALDYDFFIRVGLAFQVVYLPQALACFRLHGGSKTMSSEERHWREAFLVSQRHGLRPLQLWYWLRRGRHWALRALPGPLNRWVRGRLGRAQDAVALDGGGAMNGNGEARSQAT